VPVAGRLLDEIRGRVGRLCPFSESNPGTFNRTLRRLAGIERFHVHQLRHTFACRFLEHTRDLIALQEILGHASIETTQRYARLSADHVRAAAAKFAAEVGADG
jgi:integrase/recombinase XerC/integrase/recombinase XerD